MAPKIQVGVTTQKPRLAKNDFAPSDGFDTTFKIQVYYDTDEGVLQIPLAGPDETESRIVKTSGKYSKKIIQWIAERVGSIPEIPSAKTSDPNETLEYKVVGTASAEWMPDGKNRLYSISGTYVYAIKKAYETDKDHEIPNTPFEKRNIRNKIPKNKYKKLI